MDIVGYVFLFLLGTGYMINNNDNDNDTARSNSRSKTTYKKLKNKNQTCKNYGRKGKDRLSSKVADIDTMTIENFVSNTDTDLETRTKRGTNTYYGINTCRRKEPSIIGIESEPSIIGINTDTGNTDIQLPQEFGSYVTPYFYNTLQLTGATNKIPNSNFNESFIMQGISPTVMKLLMNYPGKLKIQSLSGDSQLPKKMAPNNTINWEFETIQPPSKWESLPHDETHLDETVMTHTNMVPFYKGSITQNVDPENRLAAHKLELYTGNYKLRKDNKTEVEPSVAPTTGLSNIYGSVERRELDRYKPNNTGKKNNELPFNQVHVGRGLNQGFTAAPSGGFHDFTRIMPKTPDEQFVNPKSESKGKINHGKAPTENRPTIGVQYKYKPSLLVENKCGERNFTTTGQIQGRQLRPNVVVRDTNRKHHIGIMGHATPGATAFNRPETLCAKVQRSRNTNYKNTPYRNAVLAEGKKVNEIWQNWI